MCYLVLVENVTNTDSDMKSFYILKNKQMLKILPECDI